MTYIFFLILLIQFIGYCSTTSDDRTISKASTSLGWFLVDKRFQIPIVLNVQLTEYNNGEIIEFQQQDFFELRKYQFKKRGLYRDYQFPTKLFEFSGEVLRPKDIVDKPVLFIENKNNYHVKQGRLGNCWFIVGLINLRYFPNLFEFIVSPRDQSFDNDNYGGIFHFRFWQVGTWVDVVIDDRLPTSERKLITASSGNSNVFWPALVEKAYAKLLYRSYKKLSGGYSKIAMQDLSGCIPEYFVTQDSSNNLFEIMQDAIKRSAMIGCGSISEQKMARGVGMSLFKLKPDHAYAITAVKKVIQKNDNTEFKLIRICNPHGTKSSNPYPGKIDDIKSQLLIEIDGESWILYEDFIEYFVYVDICNLTPNPLTDDLYGKNGKKKLSLSAIEGKWMGGIESKEIIVDDFFKINPQYRMVLKESDEGDKCSILIGLSLKRRHDFVAVDDTALNFNILKFNDDDKQSLPKPLISSSKKSTQFGPEGGWGQVSHRYHLKAGTYYIVPYIYDTFKGGIFYLQILSEQENILEVYDQAIGIPNIRNMVHTLKSKGIEETDAKLFSKMVLTDGMSIDFKGLFSILRDDKFTLNQNCHIAHKLDDEIISEWKVLSETKELMLKKKLSIAKIMEIKLNIEEAFEIYQEPGFPGYIHAFFIMNILKQNGYLISLNIFKPIYSLFVKENKLIHFNDFTLIVFDLKSKLGSYCEEFNAELCQDLIRMIHDNIPKFTNLKDSEIHNLRINIDHFKIIIQFVSQLKEKFYKYASKLSHTVPFTKLKNLLDAIDYKLTYNIIASMFQTYGNEDDIFYHQFVQSVVDVSRIIGGLDRILFEKQSENGSKLYNKFFLQFWNDKLKKNNKNKRESDLGKKKI